MEICHTNGLAPPSSATPIGLGDGRTRLPRSRFPNCRIYFAGFRTCFEFDCLGFGRGWRRPRAWGAAFGRGDGLLAAARAFGTGVGFRGRRRVGVTPRLGGFLLDTWARGFFVGGLAFAGPWLGGLLPAARRLLVGDPACVVVSASSARVRFEHPGPPGRAAAARGIV